MGSASCRGVLFVLLHSTFVYVYVYVYVCVCVLFKKDVYTVQFTKRTNYVNSYTIQYM